MKFYQKVIYFVNIRLVILILFQLIIIAYCQAQNQWQISLKGGQYQYKDQLVHPLVYDGAIISSMLTYSPANSKILSFAQLDISTAPYTYNHLGNEAFHLLLQAEVGKLFYIKGGWQMGASLFTGYNYTLLSINYEHPFWLTNHSLVWHHKFYRKINDDFELISNFSLPMLSLISRPSKEVLYEYKKDYSKAHFYENVALFGLNQYRSVSLSLMIKKKKLAAGYNLRWSQLDGKRGLSKITNELTFTFFNQN